MLTSLELNMINAMVIFVFILIVFIWMWILRAKYQRQAVDHVLGEFVTWEGTGYSVLLRVEGGLVQIEPDEKKGIKGKTFPVAEKASFQVDYPEGSWCPRFLKCKIKKMVFRDFDIEPVSNLYSEELVMKPEVLYNLRRERATEIAARLAEEKGEEIAPTKSKISKNLKFWLFILGIAAAGGFIYLINKVMQLSSVLGM